MVRAGLFVFMLVGLVASGHTLYANHFRLHQGGEVRLIRGQELAERELRAAAQVMEEARMLVGTYTETSLRPFEDLTIVYATATRYCLVVVKDGNVFHLAGPGGAPTRGRCPVASP